MENKIIYSEIPDNLREQSENLKEPVDIAHMIFFPVVPFLLSVDQWLEIPREDLYFYKARYFVFSLILSLLPVLVGFLYARRKARKRQEKICRCMERAQQEDCILTFSEEGICLFSKKTGEAKDIPYEGVKEILEERDAFHILLDRGEKTFLKKYLDFESMEKLETLSKIYCPDRYVREGEEKVEEISVSIPAISSDTWTKIRGKLRTDEAKKAVRAYTARFTREMEIKEDQTFIAGGVAITAMGVVISYFESGDFSHILAVFATLLGLALTGYSQALRGLMWAFLRLCGIPSFYEAIRKRDEYAAKEYRLGKEGICDRMTGIFYPYDNIGPVIETEEELRVGCVFTYEKGNDPEQFDRLRAMLKKYTPDQYRYYEFSGEAEEKKEGKAGYIAAAVALLFVLFGRFLLPPWYETDLFIRFLAVPRDVYLDSLFR